MMHALSLRQAHYNSQWRCHVYTSAVLCSLVLRSNDWRRTTKTVLHGHRWQ